MAILRRLNPFRGDGDWLIKDCSVDNPAHPSQFACEFQKVRDNEVINSAQALVGMDDGGTVRPLRITPDHGITKEESEQLTAMTIEQVKKKVR